MKKTFIFLLVLFTLLASGCDKVNLIVNLQEANKDLKEMHLSMEIDVETTNENKFLVTAESDISMDISYNVIQLRNDTTIVDMESYTKYDGDKITVYFETFDKWSKREMSIENDSQDSIKLDASFLLKLLSADFKILKAEELNGVKIGRISLITTLDTLGTFGQSLSTLGLDLNSNSDQELEIIIGYDLESYSIRLVEFDLREAVSDIKVVDEEISKFATTIVITDHNNVDKIELPSVLDNVAEEYESTQAINLFSDYEIVSLLESIQEVNKGIEEMHMMMEIRTSAIEMGTPVEFGIIIEADVTNDVSYCSMEIDTGLFDMDMEMYTIVEADELTTYTSIFGMWTKEVMHIDSIQYQENQMKIELDTFVEILNYDLEILESIDVEGNEVGLIKLLVPVNELLDSTNGTQYAEIDLNFFENEVMELIIGYDVESFEVTLIEYDMTELLVSSIDSEGVEISELTMRIVISDHNNIGEIIIPEEVIEEAIESNN
ncbi:hypothetical protein RI065_05490 [Mycoplasmatota bacterium zrk1]